SRQEPGSPAPAGTPGAPREALGSGAAARFKEVTDLRERHHDVSELTAHPAGPPADLFQATEGRWGSREVEITDVAFLDSKGQPTFVFHSGDSLSIRLRVRANHPTVALVFGVGLFNVDGVCWSVCNILLV